MTTTSTGVHQSSSTIRSRYLLVAGLMGLVWYGVLLLTPAGREALLPNGTASGMMPTMVFGVACMCMASMVLAMLFRSKIVKGGRTNGIALSFGLPLLGGGIWYGLFDAMCVFWNVYGQHLGWGTSIRGAVVDLQWIPWVMFIAATRLWYVTFPMGFLSQGIMHRVAVSEP